MGNVPDKVVNADAVPMETRIVYGNTPNCATRHRRCGRIRGAMEGVPGFTYKIEGFTG